VNVFHVRLFKFRLLGALIHIYIYIYIYIWEGMIWCSIVCKWESEYMVDSSREKGTATRRRRKGQRETACKVYPDSIAPRIITSEFRLLQPPKTYSMGASSNRNQKHTKKKNRSFWSNHKREAVRYSYRNHFLVGWSSVPVCTFPQKKVSSLLLLIAPRKQALGRLLLGERETRRDANAPCQRFDSLHH
jgi:hypothetical protein